MTEVIDKNVKSHAFSSIDTSAIHVKNLSKVYKIYEKPRDFFKEAVTGKSHHREFWALKDISFDIAKGEVVGIMGTNGAGKSTLLRIIAGTLSKTQGIIQLFGKLSAILELGSGFHPEYSGRQNVIMSCLYMGMTKEEAESNLEPIIKFSELASVIDQPFKTYSSGMQARLTFSTAISVNPDIFIVDEALAAGDAYFVSKCFKRIQEICNSGSTVLFVSHSTYHISTLCDRAIWLENGEIVEMGEAQSIARLYDYEIHKKISGNKGEILTIEDHIEKNSKDSIQDEPPKIFRRGPMVIDRVELLDCDNNKTNIFYSWGSLIVRVWYKRLEEKIPNNIHHSLGLAIGIERIKDGVLVNQFSTSALMCDEDLKYYEFESYRLSPDSQGMLEAKIDPLQLLEGEYLLSLGILPNQPTAVEFYEYHHRIYSFRIQRTGYPSGAIFYPIVKWKHQYADACKEDENIRENLLDMKQKWITQSQQYNEISRLLIADRLHLAGIRNKHFFLTPVNVLPRIEEGFDFQNVLRKLKIKYPVAFLIWEKLLETVLETYHSDPVSSYSVEGHPVAPYFSDYVAVYRKGRILDLGCGVASLPLYLRNYPLTAIAGIDPVMPDTPHPFVFVQGVAEFIPWPDNAFETIIISTSLDHVLSLDDTLSEIKRVLSPGGNIILWVSFIANAQPYNIYKENLTAIDAYHIFHFDEGWFEELMNRYFICYDKLRFDAQSYFYCYGHKSKVI